MKQYVYKGSGLTVFDEIGRHITLREGDVITLRGDRKYEYRDFVFSLMDDDLRSRFDRVYTIEEQRRYDRIHENAMIAAMQSLITNLKDRDVSPDMHEIENVPKNAVWFADRLIEELKRKEL